MPGRINNILQVINITISVPSKQFVANLQISYNLANTKMYRWNNLLQSTSITCSADYLANIIRITYNTKKSEAAEQIHSQSKFIIAQLLCILLVELIITSSSK